MTLDAELLELVERVHVTFDEVHRSVFLGDPVANPHLYVEVIDPARVVDTPTMVLIAPWTINALSFPPDGDVPASLDVGGREHPVFAHELDALGRYLTINLVSDPRCFRDQDTARRSATILTPAFRAALQAVRGEPEVPNPDRRHLFGLICSTGSHRQRTR